MYRLSKEEYSNLLQNTIKSKCKETDKRTATNINEEGIKRAREPNVIDRIEINGTGNSFITRIIKKNFKSTNYKITKSREISRISKNILQNIPKYKQNFT